MDAPLTPNHLHKRRRIIEAAQAVLRREGASACSTRSIARESGVNKGLIHYYFNNVEEIVDAAMGEMVDAIVERIRAPGERQGDPTQRFWYVVEEHLAAFENPPGQTMLWMDYWTDTMRRSKAEILGRIDDAIVAALTNALTEAHVPEPRTRARAVTAYVTGVAIRRAINPQTEQELRAEIALIIEPTVYK